MNKQLLLLVFVGLIALSCSKENIITPQTANPSPLREVRMEEIALKLDPALHARIGALLDAGMLKTKSAELDDFFKEYEIIGIKKAFTENEEFALRHKKAGLDRWYKLSYDASKWPDTKAGTRISTMAIERLAKIDGVEIAEPVMRYRINSTNDPEFYKQWALATSSYGVDINVKSVWDNITSGSSDVIVAVVDTGVDPNHEDLQAALDKSISHNFLNGGGTLTACTHGTHVAGIISAQRNNAIGVAGIAGGDALMGIAPTRIMACQCGDEEFVSDCADGIVWAADHGALIAQNSWGYNYDSNNDGALTGNELSYALSGTITGVDKAAVDYFTDYAGCDASGKQLPNSLMKGGLVIFAAGNDNIANGVPANYDRVVAVASIDNDGYRSYYSNYGDWVDICAPGGSIMSTIPGSYGYLSGTSMACPQVSGVAALVLAVRGGTGFTNEMLRDCLVKGAKKIDSGTRHIGPLVDALGAVSYGVVSKPGEVNGLSVDVFSNVATFSCNVPDNGEGAAAYAVRVFVAKDREVLENLNIAMPGMNVKTFEGVVLGRQLGETAEVVASGLDFEREYYYMAAAMNYGLVYGKTSEIGRFFTGENTPPVIEADRAIESWSIKATKKDAVKFRIYDEAGHKLTVKFNSGSKADKFEQGFDGLWELSVDGTAVDAGTYSAEIVATDSYRLETRLTVEYRVLENNPPVAAKILEGVLFEGESGSKEFDMSEMFADPDEDDLSFSVETSSNKIANAMVNGTRLFITPKGIGSCTVSAKARDMKNASAVQEIKVIVREKGEKISLSPVQVVDVLNVETGEELEMAKIRIYAMSGALVAQRSVEASAFRPAKVDMSGLAPGQYVVEVSCGGIVSKKTVVKL